jgi:hypothetical protein
LLIIHLVTWSFLAELLLLLLLLYHKTLMELYYTIRFNLIWIKI